MLGHCKISDCGGTKGWWASVDKVVGYVGPTHDGDEYSWNVVLDGRRSGLWFCKGCHKELPVYLLLDALRDGEMDYELSNPL